MSQGRDPIVELLREVVDNRVEAVPPGALLNDIATTVSTTPQRRRARWGLDRLAWAGAPAVTATIAIVLVVGLAGLVLRPIGPGGTASPPPSPSPTAPVLPRAGWSPAIDGPPLAAGSWQPVHFEPTIRFRVSEGIWTAGIDTSRQLLLRAHLPGEVPEPEHDVLTLVAIESTYVDPCANGAAEQQPWDASLGPAGLLDWLEAATSADLGPRAPVVLGDLDGLEVELASPDLVLCTGGFLAITDVGTGSPFRLPPAGTPLRLAAVDALGHAVLVATWAHEPSRRDIVWAAADDVLRTIVLAP
jgi:hypothetical protein